MLDVQLCAHMFKETERGEDTQTRRGEFGPLSEAPHCRTSGSLVAQTAHAVDKAAISLPVRDTASNCRPLTEGHSASPQRRSQKAIAPGKGGADVTAALGEKKRGH